MDSKDVAGSVSRKKVPRLRDNGILYMLLIELFRGTGSVGKVATQKGWKVISVDMDAEHGATYTMDVRKLPYKDLPVPDLVWASPPCTTYSHAANWVRHREAGTGRALSADAHDADSVVRHTIKMIRYWSKLNPNMCFCIENPRGYLRHQPIMQAYERTSTRYSWYGWPIEKPTDFFTNFPLRLKTSGPPATTTIRVGKDKGWRRDLRAALGAKEGQSSAVVLGRIPPALVRSILTQMASANASRRASPRRRRLSS